MIKKLLIILLSIMTSISYAQNEKFEPNKNNFIGFRGDYILFLHLRYQYEITNFDKNFNIRIGLDKLLFPFDNEVFLGRGTEFQILPCYKFGKKNQLMLNSNFSYRYEGNYFINGNQDDFRTLTNSLGLGLGFKYIFNTIELGIELNKYFSYKDYNYRHGQITYLYDFPVLGFSVTKNY